MTSLARNLSIASSFVSFFCGLPISFLLVKYSPSIFFINAFGTSFQSTCLKALQAFNKSTIKSPLALVNLSVPLPTIISFVRGCPIVKAS